MNKNKQLINKFKKIQKTIFNKKKSNKTNSKN